jgi:hypothetical protein
MWPFRNKTSLALIKGTLPRVELLRRGRIAVLDDEAPEMLQDLRDRGLSIGHITSTDDPQFQTLADCFYDLLLLDYGGIGPRFGQDEGLDVLRYLKRVNPSLRILAFTARTFDASKADFFRLCDGVVKKDAGIRETLEQMEVHLSEILTPSYQFAALAQSLALNGEQRVQLEKVITRAINRPDGREKALAAAKRFAKGGSEKALEALVRKTIELGIACRTSNGYA